MRKAKIFKKVMIGFSTVALVLSISIPAFADSLTLGWMTTGSYTGYPYISWTTAGSLWGEVGTKDRSSGAVRNVQGGTGYNNLYVRTPSTYSETLYTGYYAYKRI